MSIDEKVRQTLLFFSDCTTEEKYEKILELGQNLFSLEPRYKTDDNLLAGCQSRLYLHSYLKNEKIYFEAEADALISAGLAALLIRVYSGQNPEEVIQHDASFLTDLKLRTSLSMTRSEGLSHILLRMKQDALKLSVTT